MLLFLLIATAVNINIGDVLHDPALWSVWLINTHLPTFDLGVFLS